MDNILISIAMLYVIATKEHSRIAAIILLSCLLSQLVYLIGIDIALYYGVTSVIGVATAWYALKLKSVSGYVLSCVMIMQSILTVSLVPDWSYSVNELLQFELKQFNATMIIILLTLGFTGSGNDKPSRRDNNT